MSIRFHAVSDPSKELCKKLESFDPVNPFYTLCYIESKRILGFQPWVLCLRDESGLISACSAFMKSAFWLRSLEIESLPNLPAPEAFWDGLLRFCKQNRITYLGTYSSSSSTAKIPKLPGEIKRYIRSEYVLELENSDLRTLMRSSHRYRVNRARKAGLKIRLALDDKALDDICLL